MLRAGLNLQIFWPFGLVFGPALRLSARCIGRDELRYAFANFALIRALKHHIKERSRRRVAMKELCVLFRSKPKWLVMSFISFQRWSLVIVLHCECQEKPSQAYLSLQSSSHCQVLHFATWFFMLLRSYLVNAISDRPAHIIFGISISDCPYIKCLLQLLKKCRFYIDKSVKMSCLKNQLRLCFRPLIWPERILLFIKAYILEQGTNWASIPYDTYCVQSKRVGKWSIFGIGTNIGNVPSPSHNFVKPGWILDFYAYLERSDSELQEHTTHVILASKFEFSRIFEDVSEQHKIAIIADMKLHFCTRLCICFQ